MSNATRTLEVGQVVYLRGVNIDRRKTYTLNNRPNELTITKVGRKLATVRLYGRDATFRLDTMIRNDAYGHEWLQTIPEFEEEVRRREFMVWARMMLDIGEFEPIFHYATRIPWRAQEAMIRAGVEALSSEVDPN